MTSPESQPSNTSCTCFFLCLFYYRERLREYCTQVIKKIHLLSLKKNAQGRASWAWVPASGADVSSLCRPEANFHEWWLLMSPRSCLATVSINFCLSRSFFRNCANMLFLRLVSLILNRGRKKENKVFEETMVEGDQEGGGMAPHISTSAQT